MALQDDYYLHNWPWSVGTGSLTGFTKNGEENENTQFIGFGPFNRPTIIWAGHPDGDGGDGGAGGWNGSLFPIDNTKTYRFSVWYNRVSLGNPADWTAADRGRHYFGCRGYTNGTNTGVVNLSSGLTDTNFYFYNVSSSNYAAWYEIGEWHLMVSFIHPHDYTGPIRHPDTGVWRKDGTSFYDMYRNAKWLPTSTHTLHRVYLYYFLNDDTALQYWCYPRVDLVDGNEPSLQKLLRHGVSRTLNTSIGRIVLT